jgi:hypothetical protein
MLYQDLSFPNKDAGYYNYDHSITPVKDPGPNSFYFWAVQFNTQNGNVGYMGLQTDVLGNNGNNIGKGVNVALWGATNATAVGENAAVRNNTDGQPGRAVYMPYLWEEGVCYRMRVWQNGSDANGFWWQFWVKNENTGIDTHIGNIYVPNKNYIGNQTIAWTEYYGAGKNEPCGSPVRKPETVFFLNPSMNNDANNPGQEVKPSSASLRKPACPNYYIVEEPDYLCVQSVNFEY